MSVGSPSDRREALTIKTLSKSRFKLALECPTKVYYSLDKRYVNANDSNDFLKSLAFGGFQVGELAKAMYRVEDPNAIEIEGNQATQLAQTQNLITRKNVTLFEPTFLDDNLLARVDILKKRGRVIDLIEVKSIGWDRDTDSLVGKTARSDPLTPAWRSYVFDLSFQHFLLSRRLPTLLGTTDFELRSWLLLLDNKAQCSLGGLAFQFPIVGEGRSARAVTSSSFDVSSLTEPLLIAVDASEAVSLVFKNHTSSRKQSNIDFEALIRKTALSVRNDKRIPPAVGAQCKACEFYASPETIVELEQYHDRDLHSDANGKAVVGYQRGTTFLNRVPIFAEIAAATDNDQSYGEVAGRRLSSKSGWTECMSFHFKTADVPPRDASIFSLYRKGPVDELVARGRLWLRDVSADELPEADPDTQVITLERRHRLQRAEALGKSESIHINKAAIEAALRSFKFPLHFIDFETARPALPYYRGHHPYQTILFQFSHHIMEEDGSIRHASEFLQYDQNTSPSIDAVRALKSSLGSDSGTVLHWYHHERTVLREIAEEIENLQPPDAPDLLQFLTVLGMQKGAGRLFDFGRLMEEQVFLAGTQGSSSMKHFLPAVLNNSKFLQNKYSKPIYGTELIPSKNFRQMTWIERDETGIRDPYHLLTPIFQDARLSEAIGSLEQTEGSVIANGAAAMMAYSAIVSGSSNELTLSNELKRYCELDTLGMVFVVE